MVVVGRERMPYIVMQSSEHVPKLEIMVMASSIEGVVSLVREGK
jgi:hypothetical protein